MKKTITIFLILLTLVIVSGCSEEDCSAKDTTYEKFTWDEDLKECISRKIEQNKCGNSVAEEGENYCNCPQDVSREHPKYGCSGNLGEYLEKSCNTDNECILTQNTKVVEEVKAIQLRNNDIFLDGIFTFNKPFILNTEDKNKLKVEISFLKEASTSKKIRNLAVSEIRIIADTRMAGNAIYNENLEKIADRLSVKYIPLADIDRYDKTSTVKAELLVSYTVDSLDSKGEVIKTEEKIETLTGALGRIDFINPVFYD
jgi:hypothetical protein